MSISDFYAGTKPKVPSVPRNNWRTPAEVFDYANRRYGPFTLDAAASHDNALCRRYFTAEDDGLAQSWEGEVVWLNCPYGQAVVNGKKVRSAIPYWVAKAAAEAERGVRTCMLLPAWTDRQWFHEHCLGKPNVIVEYLPGRVRFVGAPQGAPWGSMFVVFLPKGGQSCSELHATQRP